MPSFAIEVAGEANPLTDGLLVHTLKSAASSDPHQIQTGTKQLQQWEKSPGYYRHLQAAYLDTQLPVEIRYLAIIQLKNGIDKYWRKTATNAVSNNDKDVIRSHLLGGALNEQDNRLALQNALVIAKVARFEFPNEWPDALSSLTTALRSGLPILSRARALLVLLHVVKELSTGRLQRTRQSLQAATPEMLYVLGTLYSSLFSSWQGALEAKLPANSQTSRETQTDQEATLITLKILRRLLVSGYENPHRHEDVSAIWQLTQAHLNILNHLEKADGDHATGTKIGLVGLSLIQKHMVQLAKLHHEMSREHPASFALLPNSIDLVRAYWSLAKDFGETFGSKEAITSAVAAARIGTDGDVGGSRSSTERLALKGILVVRACVKMVHNPSQTFKHRTPEDKEEKNRATAMLRERLLNEAFVQQMVETLVSKFFVFRESDLREWEEEPEEWEKREEGGGEDWEFSIRSCSEKLFLDLVINYKDIVVQPLIQAFYSVAHPKHENVLMKDSIYTAIGLAAPVVHEHLDFDSFIRDVLVIDVQKPNLGYNIIRRRAAILLGQWISIKVSESTRPTVFEIFQYLLNKDDSLNDQVVRVTAGRQFKSICDSWEFIAEQFVPYAEVILTRLMDLVDEVELPETKMTLLNTISVIVERLDHHISPFAERIVTMLPGLWEKSGEEHLMKQTVLTILARLVNALKADSLPMHSLVFPIIRGAVEPGSETEVYLLDDALDLWAAILVQTPEPASVDLLTLVPHLYPIYELGSDNLRRALEITESYVVLAPEHMLSEKIRLPLFSALSSLMGTLRPDGNGIVCNLIELTIRAADKLGGANAVSQTASDLVRSGFLVKIVEGLRGSWAAHCTSGPLKKDPPVDGIVETDYFSILARILLGDPDVFCSCLEGAAKLSDASTSLGQTIPWLLEEWFSHFENVGDPPRRKLMCLALTKLLQVNQTSITSSLQLFMNMWTDVITELCEDATDASGDSLVYADPGTTYGDGPEAPEEGRRRQLTYSDAIHTVSLPRVVRDTMEALVARCGGSENFSQLLLVDVDQDVVQAFGRLGIMSG